jgi:hypothetical protein
MNVGNEVIRGFKIPKMFVNFNNSHYLKLMWPKERKPEYIWPRTEMSFF